MILMGEKIKGLRTSHHLSQRQFADLLGVSKSTLAAYENDSRTPSYEVLARLARTYHVSTDFFILGEDTSPTISVTGLSREQIYHVILMVEGLQTTNLVKEIVREDLTAAELKAKNKQIFGKDNIKAGIVVDKLIDLVKPAK